MPKLPAYEGVELDHGGCAVVLRPSLRAAARLERLHDGFPALLQKVEEFDMRTIRAVVAYCLKDYEADELLDHVAKHPLGAFAKDAQPAIFDLINAMLPEPPEGDEPQGGSTGQPMPWAKVYSELFGLATGWLGWTPETAWNATPQEISDAFAAHIAKLKAIHGSDDDTATKDSAPTYSKDQLARIEAQGHDPAFDRAGLRALKSKGKL